MVYGEVTSVACHKTITVTIGRNTRHPKFGKTIRKRTRLHVHDEQNEAQVGDKVWIAVCRPISKTKQWRLLRIEKRAAGGAS